MSVKTKKQSTAPAVGGPVPGNLIRKTLTVEQVLANFPFDKPRPIQVEAIQKVVDAYNRGMHYVFLEVPVGGGKSGIALAMARTLNDAFLVTLTEQLQNQYMKDFAQHGLKVLKGRAKYDCEACGGSCALGRTLKMECETCPYKTAKALAIASRLMVCNYHSFYANLGGPRGYAYVEGWRTTGALSLPTNREGDSPPPPRRLAIWDEAHTMEAFLLDQMGLEVNLNSLAVTPEEPMPSDAGSDPGPYWTWIADHLLPAIAHELENVADPRERERLEMFQESAASALARRETDDWVPERPEDAQGKPDPFRLIMKPLQVHAYGKNIWGWADFNIFMSGTILSAWQMVKVLGLDPEKGDHIVMPSPFPAKNRPIYTGNLDMTYKARDVSWPIMAQQVNALMSRHANEKGLILAPSNAMLDYIFKHLSRENAGRFLKAAGNERLRAYQTHLDTKAPTVLAAPGLWEGADLKGDASRFQILPSVPRAFFKGQTEARAKLDRTWYRWINYMKVLQGIGRSVRTEDDWAATYILDQDFAKEAERNDTMIPAWVREAIVEGIPSGAAPRTVKAKAKVLR